MTELPPGLREELLTTATARALSAFDEELVSRAELDAAEAPDRLARHLAAVTKRLLAQMSDYGLSPDEQAQIVNRAVELLSPEDADEADLLSLPIGLLHGIA